MIGMKKTPNVQRRTPNVQFRALLDSMFGVRRSAFSVFRFSRDESLDPRISLAHPAVPLCAAVVILSLANSRRRTAAGLAIVGQIIALALSVFAFRWTLHEPGVHAIHNFTWFTFGDNPLRIGWVLDPLAAAMMLMITLVGLCIFVFSIGYMADDKNFTRFFAYLSFFSAAMLGVVIANSLLLLFVCWELVGLASYLLDRFLDRPTERCSCGQESIHHHPHRRSRIFSRDALALQPNRHTALLR